MKTIAIIGGIAGGACVLVVVIIVVVLVLALRSYRANEFSVTTIEGMRNKVIGNRGYSSSTSMTISMWTDRVDP